MTNNGNCFTTKYDGRVNTLKNEVIISPSKYFGDENKIKITALWDTGASGSLITQNIAKKLNLIEVEIAMVHTPSGEMKCPVYLIDLYLPNRVIIPKVRVAEGIPTNCDMLIGMDVIGCGDFAVSNYKNQTTFSFRIPSLETIDFCQHSYRTPEKNSVKPKPNDLCPCGSGKKYKKCHGSLLK
jgi:predicted aspartyl protease